MRLFSGQQHGSYRRQDRSRNQYETESYGGYQRGQRDVFLQERRVIMQERNIYVEVIFQYLYYFYSFFGTLITRLKSHVLLREVSRVFILINDNQISETFFFSIAIEIHTHTTGRENDRLSATTRSSAQNQTRPS